VSSIVVWRLSWDITRSNIIYSGNPSKGPQKFYFLESGPHVSVGEIACVPAWDIMHNESKYPNADTFDGLRFVKSAAAPRGADDVMRGTTYTDASKDYPIWGLGSKVW